MKKAKVISFILSMVGIMMISIALIVENQSSLSKSKDIEFKEISLSNVAASTNMLIKNSNEEEEATDLPLEEIKMEVVPASVYVPPRVEVYAGLTIEELSAKLDRSLGGILAGHGYTIAQHSLDLGVMKLVMVLLKLLIIVIILVVKRVMVVVPTRSMIQLMKV